LISLYPVRCSGKARHLPSGFFSLLNTRSNTMKAFPANSAFRPLTNIDVYLLFSFQIPFCLPRSFVPPSQFSVTQFVLLTGCLSEFFPSEDFINLPGSFCPTTSVPSSVLGLSCFQRNSWRPVPCQRLTRRFPKRASRSGIF